MQHHYFYILYSPNADKYYTGHTRDLPGRLRRHNSEHKGYTGGWSDWGIVCTETYATKEEAYQREREVKSWKSRKRIEELLQKKPA
ncbi:MAG: GIY-YIG nuclease family protein [Bacteroidales bacterium]|nr:GIY-YIG nuclease family protein [Bacteroidales bacterium]